MKKKKIAKPLVVRSMYQLAEEYGWDEPPLPACGVIKTGIPLLDEKIGNIAGLVVIGGDPGVGKSTLLTQIACLALKKKAVVFWIETERSKSAVYEDLRAYVLGIRREAARQKQPPPGRLRWKKWAITYGQRCNQIDRSISPLDLEDIVAFLKRESRHKRHSPILLAIDSLQAFAGEVYPDESEKVAIDRVIRTLAKLPETICTVCVSQVPKSTYRSNVSKEKAFLGSSSILHLAELALVIDSKEGKGNSRKIQIVKSRITASGQKVPVVLDAERFRFEEQPYRYGRKK